MTAIDPTPFGCEEAQAARLDQASGMLAEDRAHALAAHVALCTPCRRFVRELDALEGLLASTMAVGPRAAPAPSGPASRLPAPRAARPVAAALASLGVVAVAVGWLLAPTPTQPQAPRLAAATARPAALADDREPAPALVDAEDRLRFALADALALASER